MVRGEGVGMDFNRANLENCANAQGTVVVIDVLRAFSTAAYAFGLGARRILLAGAIEDAFRLKKRFPSALLMGEEDGLPIAGFDYSNSPTALVERGLGASELIQRTSAGTQGIVRSKKADLLLAASFCCADATARMIHQFPPKTVTFVITGQGDPGWGDEDEACADYIEGLLKGENPPVELYLQRARSSEAGKKFMDARSPGFLASDLEYCLVVDRFDFGMQVEREGGVWVMKPVFVDPPTR
ncbi:MAG: 2-phosphosulfolactate phosphatase [Chloroflexi bacterium]|nr:2-phosphosulfolactate phosphatase [Chloroflexota bacterium]